MILLVFDLKNGQVRFLMYWQIQDNKKNSFSPFILL